MAKTKKLKIEVCDLDTVEAVTDLFKEVLTDYRAQALTLCLCTSADIEYESEQVENKIENYKQKLVDIFAKVWVYTNG